MERARFVVHLPVLATDLDGARAEATVSEEDAQRVRHRVYCDLLLDGGRRCPHPADHDGACGPAGHR
ncbi:hypothetical protein ACFO0M_08895 [Micromonospora mangrovi]|uniref:Uncharacterized protein n=2 Tax=Micromonospora TaxID=1873 RepID=A0AAU7M6T1_9ACTN